MIIYYNIFLLTLNTFLLNKNFFLYSIKRERFIVLANEISTIFEGDNPAVYYIPFAVENNHKSLAAGKLWDHYNYTKGRWREADLLRRRKRETVFYVVTENGKLFILQFIIKIIRLKNFIILFVIYLDFSNIEWLSSHIEPWQEVEKRWAESFEARKEILGNKDSSIDEYLQKFPCLRTQNAKKLVIHTLLYTTAINITSLTSIKLILRNVYYRFL